MAVNPYIELDLMKPRDVFTDLTPNFQGRIGDSQSIIKLWIKMNGLPYDLRKKEVEFAGIDPEGKKKLVNSTIVDRTTGDNVGVGRISFVFPAGTFAAVGYWDEENTFFRIKNASDGTIISTINVKLNVLDNQVEMGITDDDIIPQIDKIRDAAQKELDDAVSDITQEYPQIKQTLQALQATEDSIQSVLKYQNVATLDYVARYHAGDLLGTAIIKPGQDLHPKLHVYAYSYGAGIAQTDVDKAGGSAVYEAIARVEYVSPKIAHIFVSTEQLKRLAPNWTMTSSPESATGGNAAYLTSGVDSLMIELDGAQQVTSFTVEPSFRVEAK